MGKFGQVLATVAGSEVIVYKEESKGAWGSAYRTSVTGKATVCRFGPPEYGFQLAVGDDTGEVIVLILSRDAHGIRAKDVHMITAASDEEECVRSLCWGSASSPALLATGPA